VIKRVTGTRQRLGAGGAQDFAANLLPKKHAFWCVIIDAGAQVDVPEARRIAGELVRLNEAGAIKDAEDPQPSFYASLIQRFEASFTDVRFYPDYATTGSFNRRLTWNPRTDQWVDTSEHSFTCDPATVPLIGFESDIRTKYCDVSCVSAFTVATRSPTMWLFA
jgi:hypothetical protein